MYKQTGSFKESTDHFWALVFSWSIAQTERWLVFKAIEIWLVNQMAFDKHAMALVSMKYNLYYIKVPPKNEKSMKWIVFDIFEYFLDKIMKFWNVNFRRIQVNFWKPLIFCKGKDFTCIGKATSRKWDGLIETLSARNKQNESFLIFLNIYLKDEKPIL